MTDIIFPKGVPAGCDLVIYGENITGFCFYEQIRSLGHCNVVAFIDRRPEGNPYGVPSFYPEWLKDNENKYQYILLGSFNPAAVSQISDTLTKELNISSARLIRCGYRPFLVRSGIADTDNTEEVISMLAGFGKNSETSEKAVNYIINVIGEGGDNAASLTEGIKSLYRESSGFKLKAVCAYILFKTGYGEKDIFYDFYQELKENAAKYPQYVYIMAFNVMAGVVLRHPDFCYDEHYTDINIIIDRCAHAIYGDRFKNAAVERKEKRIAICANSVFGSKYHLTGIISNLANWLCGNGYEVSVFVESKCFGGGEFFAEGRYFGSGVKVEAFAEDNKTIFDNRVGFVYNSGSTLAERLNSHVANVIRYTPDRIIYFQTDCTCATRPLYDLFPILSFPTVSSLPVSGYYHCTVSPDKELVTELIRKYHYTDDAFAFEYKIAMIPAPDIVKKRNRSLYGWKDSDFIMVTVGNRLKYDLTCEFTDMVCGELMVDPDLKWVIVGTDNDQYAEQKYNRLIRNKQIEFIPYDNNLMELYEIVDAYVNPDRLGGGTTIAWAMLSGLPVLANHTNSAGRLWIRRENCTRGYADMAQCIRKLKADTEFYREKSMHMKKTAAEYTIDSMCSSLLEITKAAISRFQNLQNKREGNHYDTI